MPVVRTAKGKRHACDFGSCTRAFERLHDLRRHQRSLHGEGEREHKCTYEGCEFSAHQKSNLDTHINSRHKKIRLPCGKADCSKTFTDASSRTKHRQKFHHFVEVANSESTKSPVPIRVHKQVIRHIEENSPENAKEVLDQFAAFTVESLGDPTPSAPSSPSTDQSPSPSSSNVVSDEPLPSPSTPNTGQMSPSRKHQRVDETLSPTTAESEQDGGDYDVTNHAIPQIDSRPSSRLTEWSAENEHNQNQNLILLYPSHTRIYFPNGSCPVVHDMDKRRPCPRMLF